MRMRTRTVLVVSVLVNVGLVVTVGATVWTNRELHRVNVALSRYVGSLEDSVHLLKAKLAQSCPGTFPYEIVPVPELNAEEAQTHGDVIEQRF